MRKKGEDVIVEGIKKYVKNGWGMCGPNFIQLLESLGLPYNPGTNKAIGRILTQLIKDGKIVISCVMHGGYFTFLPTKKSLGSIERIRQKIDNLIFPVFNETDHCEKIGTSVRLRSRLEVVEAQKRSIVNKLNNLIRIGKIVISGATTKGHLTFLHVSTN